MSFHVLSSSLSALVVVSAAAHPVTHVDAMRAQEQPTVAANVVHDHDGQRFDVPAELLRSPGVLINGLPPVPQQFD